MSAEADRQIEQMMAFILQEAKEKAEEIRVKTEKEFMAEKLTLETNKSNDIRNDSEKNKKNYLVTKKIEKSKKVTEATFQKMKRRDEKINELKREILVKLADVSASGNYKQLIVFLLAQSLLTIQETHVEVRCRKEDIAIVKGAVAPAIELFHRTVANVANGFQPAVVVTVTDDEKNFLPPGPVKGSNTLSCSGGIILSARNGTILCRNTLDSRLDLAFQQLMPTVRAILFGVREKAAAKAEQKKHGVSLPK